MQKRIAVISYHTCPLASEEGKETGGMNVYILQYAKELAKAGFLVDIFTRSQDQAQQHIVHVIDNLRVIHVKAGPESYILPNSEENKAKFFEYLPEFTRNIEEFAAKENITYDLWDAHYYLSGLVGLELQKKQNTPLVMTFHTLALMKNLILRNELTEQEKKRIAAEILLTQNTQRIISPSENEKKYLQYLYNVSPDKITIVSPGVDTKLFYPTDKEKAKKKIGADLDHKIILYVGRIEPVKGLDVLLYSLKILLEQHPKLKACLWIIGGDVSQEPHLWSKDLKKLSDLQQILNLHTTVKFIGQKPQHELPDYYNAADLVVMPSHYESFGMTALEAMACATPIITTNVTGISNLLDERYQKHITTANNPLLLAESMAEALTHHHEGKDHAMAELVKDYDWQNVTQKIKELFDSLIA